MMSAMWALSLVRKDTSAFWLATRINAIIHSSIWYKILWSKLIFIWFHQSWSWSILFVNSEQIVYPKIQKWWQTYFGFAQEKFLKRLNSSPELISIKVIVLKEHINLLIQVNYILSATSLSKTPRMSNYGFHFFENG